MVTLRIFHPIEIGADTAVNNYNFPVLSSGWLPLKRSSPAHAVQLASILGQIDGTPHVVASVFVGYDGQLITSALAYDQRVVIFSLSMYINTINAVLHLGHHCLHQLVCSTDCGYLIVADFKGAILIVTTDCHETDSFIAVERSSCTHLNGSVNAALSAPFKSAPRMHHGDTHHRTDTLLSHGIWSASQSHAVS